MLGSPLARSQQHQSSAISHQASVVPSETAKSKISKAGQVNDKDVSIPMTQQPDNPSPLSPCKSLPKLAAAESSVSEASHLSTREVLFDHREPNVLYMVLRQYRVSMRTSDGQLHVGQILKVRNVTRSQRDSYWYKLKARGLNPPWVPFGDGVFLCQATGLSEELQPLLSLLPDPQPNPTQNYFLNARGFATLAWKDRLFAYRPWKRTINATSLLGLSNKPKEHLEKVLQENPRISAEEINASTHQALDGIYISATDVEVLCSTLGLDMTVTGMLLKVCRPGVSPALFPWSQKPEISSPFNDGDLILIRIGHQIVSMNRDTYEWNLSQILSVSDLETIDCDRTRVAISRIVQLREEKTSEGVQYWTSFLNGVHVIHHLWLHEMLKDLITRTTIDLPTTPSLQYHSLVYDGIPIYFTNWGEINLHSIASWGSISRHTLKGFVNRKHIPNRIAHKGTGQLVRGTYTQWTYAKYVCLQYNMDLGPISVVEKHLLDELLRKLE